MKKNKSQSSKKVKFTLDIPEKTFFNLNKYLVEKHGRTYGHIGATFLEGLKLWMIKENIGDLFVEQ